MLRLDPAFTLIEEGRAVPVMAGTGGLVDVAETGVARLIGGLLSEDTLYVRRDASVPQREVKNGEVWLQTSGTTGAPKWVSHTRESLSKRIAPGADKARWLLTFNPGSFAGLQVILSAMTGGHALIVPPYGADVSAMADLAVSESVTHVSGTPTFWRAFLMALGNRPLALKSVTLGGEAADQAILNALHARFPQAALRHIYATTEAGTVFSVKDGLVGFPRDWLGDDLSISADDTLKVRGRDTGDVVELSGNRVIFRGRRDSMVNVGGVKVYPETVESFLLELPFIRDVRISPKPNPITGHVLTADIVLKDAEFADAPVQIKAHLQGLPRAQRPASLRFVEALDIGATGKKARS